MTKPFSVAVMIDRRCAHGGTDVHSVLRVCKTRRSALLLSEMKRFRNIRKDNAKGRMARKWYAKFTNGKKFFELYIYIFLTYLALFMLILNDFIWTPPPKKTKVSKPLLAQHHLPRSPSFYFLLPKCHINIRGRARLSAETCSIWQPLISMQGVLSEAPHSPKNYPTPRPSDKFICLAVRRGRKGWLRERDKGGEGWKSLSWEKKKWQTGDKRNINRQGQASQCS